MDRGAERGEVPLCPHQLATAGCSARGTVAVGRFGTRLLLKRALHCRRPLGKATSTGGCVIPRAGRARTTLLTARLFVDVGLAWLPPRPYRPITRWSPTWPARLPGRTPSRSP